MKNDTNLNHFLWGSFSFAQGYRTHFSSRGLNDAVIQEAIEVLTDDERKSAARFASRATRGTPFALYAESLRKDGRHVIASAFVPDEKDHVGRTATYAIQGFIFEPDRSRDSLEMAQELLRDGHFRFHWTSDDVDAASISPRDFFDGDEGGDLDAGRGLDESPNKRSQEEERSVRTMLRWCAAARQRVAKPAKSFRIVRGELVSFKAGKRTQDSSGSDYSHMNRGIDAKILHEIWFVICLFSLGFGFLLGQGRSDSADNDESLVRLHEAVDYCAEEWGLGNAIDISDSPAKAFQQLLTALAALAPENDPLDDGQRSELDNLVESIRLAGEGPVPKVGNSVAMQNKHIRHTVERLLGSFSRLGRANVGGRTYIVGQDTAQMSSSELIERLPRELRIRVREVLDRVITDAIELSADGDAVGSELNGFTPYHEFLRALLYSTYESEILGSAEALSQSVSR